MISVNRRAAVIVRRMMEDAEALGIRIIRLDNGAVVLDTGIEAPGSYEGGRLFSEACMGGLGEVSIIHQNFEAGEGLIPRGCWFPAAAVNVACPAIACMGSQLAGWALQLGSYSAMASGPARALAASEEIFQQIHYTDSAEEAVLILEGRPLPDVAVAEHVAARCAVRPENLMLLVAPTASLIGSIQIAARSVETGMHKLAELGFDVRHVEAATGLCPIAPAAIDDLRAMGRTNDALLYGSQVFLSVKGVDAELEALVDQVPSSGSPDYGTPFYDILMRHGGGFFGIDRRLFSPARVALHNLESGRTFTAGEWNIPLLRSSLLGE